MRLIATPSSISMAKNILINVLCLRPANWGLR
ncbi:Uncharacterised protein [Vibrio cholerae]|nr:Uncharacterised protein [Vibrio cholerae]